MKAPNASAPWLCLALAATWTLSSCASLGKPVTTLTPRSEAACDKSPPEPVPPIPGTHPDFEAAFRLLTGLYSNEITKYVDDMLCRLDVREANAKAAAGK